MKKSLTQVILCLWIQTYFGITTIAQESVQAPSAKELNNSAASTHTVDGYAQRETDGDLQLTSKNIGPGGIYLTVEGAPAFARLLADDLANSGYLVAKNQTLATSKLTIQIYGSLAVKGKSYSVDLVNAYEAVVTDREKPPMKLPAQIVINNKTDSSPVKSLYVPSNGYTSQMNGFNLAAAGLLIGNILKITGLHAKLNEALTGDSRGICLFKCGYWNHAYNGIVIKSEFQDADHKHHNILLTDVILIREPDLGLAFQTAWADYKKQLSGTPAPICSNFHTEGCERKL